MSHDASLLLAAILDAPDDDAARLVYADCLQELGGDERAEFIRVQVELAREMVPGLDAAEHIETLLRHAVYPPDDPAIARWRRLAELQGRERALLAGFPAAPYWGLPPSLDLTHPHRYVPTTGPRIVCHGRGVRQVTAEFRRGSVERVVCETADWLAHGDAILAAHPVRRATLTTGFEVAILPTGFEVRAGAETRRYETRPRPSDPIPHSIGEVMQLVWPRVAFELTTGEGVPV